MNEVLKYLKSNTKGVIITSDRIDHKLYLVTDCGAEARPWLSAGRQFCVQRHHQAGGDPRREAHADSEADRQL